MIHLFVIHSYITYIIAKEVILYNQIPLKDCYFLYTRGFKPADTTENLKEEQFPFSHHPVKSFPVRYIFWRSWRALKEFDTYINRLTTGKKFVIYCNQSGLDYILLLISHKKCNGFNFLEEGVASYYLMKTINEEICPAGYSTLNYKILSFLNYKGRIPIKKNFYDPRYWSVYGINASSFPKFERKILLPYPFFNSTLTQSYQNILVMDGTGEYGLVKDENIIATLHECQDRLLAHNIKDIWIKFHPEQIRNPKTLLLYRSFFMSPSKKINYYELPENLCLEYIAGNTNLKNINFIVFLSSIGLYAAQSGRKVYSLAKLVVKYEKSYQKIISSLPDLYKESVQFL